MNPAVQTQSALTSPPARRAAPGAGRRLAAAALTLLLTTATTGARGQDATQKWVGTWAASPQTQEAFLGAPAPTPPVFTNQTLRQVVHTSLGGSGVRVRFSNALGTTDLVIGAAHVAYRGGGAEIQAGSDRTLTFGGRPGVTIPVGALVVSDPVSDFAVPASSDLAVSVFLPNATGTTAHNESKQTNYTLPGDQTGAAQPTVAATQLPYYFLSNVETMVSRNTRGIVTLGDSITDGTNSTADTNQRWPNFFARRLLAKPGARGHQYDAGVMDQGIAGNRLLHNIIGPNALSRFDRDVIAQAGVTDVILLEGINDIGFGGFVPTEIVGADDLIAAYRQIIARAHDAGLRIYGCTLTPFAITDLGGIPYYSDAGEAKRQAVNVFIRSGGEFDGVIDFEAALRDGSNPPRMLPQYDSGDHLHPNDAGYQAMANAINLKLFKHNP